MLLTAALIVRDEQRWLDGCLDSIADLVDEIVVVDTGSVDDTVAIAERHGAVVGHTPWRDDFAAARNVSLDLASGEWILYIDADERVRPGDHAGARAALADDADRIAGLIPFVPRVGWTPYREYRLWRNRDDIRFVGSMHESIVPAVRAAAERTGSFVTPFDGVTIDHFGYEGDQRHKHARDIPLLLAEIDRLPHRSYLYDHLARTHQGLGDHEAAVDTWRRGIAMTEARGTTSPDDLLLHVDLAFHLLAHGSLDDAAPVIEAAIERFERLPTLELAAARLDFAQGRHDDALARVEWLLELTPTEIIDSGSSYDQRVFDEWAHDLAGLCLFAKGDFGAAADAFARAAVAAPDNEVHATRRRLAAAKAAAASAGS